MRRAALTHAPRAPCLSHVVHVFFFNDTATTEIYTLSLHDALPICTTSVICRMSPPSSTWKTCSTTVKRSEEHTSELQSRLHLGCRLLLEKKTVGRREPALVRLGDEARGIALSLSGH